jgi:hypothetical protein
MSRGKKKLGFDFKGLKRGCPRDDLKGMPCNDEKESGGDGWQNTQTNYLFIVDRVEE